MNKEEINIELIRDYFAGKLDAASMHDLEKRALEDPFLAEAMEGFESNSKNAVDSLNELKTHLKERTNITAKKSFSLKPWLVAASVIVLLGVGTFFFLNNQHKAQQNISQEIVQNATKNLPQKNTDTVKIAINNIEKDTRIPQPKKNIEQQPVIIPQSNSITSVNSERSTNNADSNQLNDVAIVGYSTAKKEEITGAVVQTQKDRLQNLDDTLYNLSNPPTPSINNVLAGKAAGLAIIDRKARKQKFRVIDSVTGNPIAGASIKFQNNSATITDKRGYFHFPDTLNSANVFAVGYASKPIATNTNVVTLSPIKENLSDIVVVGYDAVSKKQTAKSVADNNNEHIMIRGYSSLRKNDSPLVIIDGKEDNLNSVNAKNIKNITIFKNAQAESVYGSQAANGVILITTKDRNSDTNTLESPQLNVSNITPKIGWNKYEKYVQSTIKKKYSEGVKGSVILHFDISASGKPINIKIIEGLNDEKNNQAIEIIRNGPLWNIQSNGIPTSVTYTIDFK